MLLLVLGYAIDNLIIPSTSTTENTGKCLQLYELIKFGALYRRVVNMSIGGRVFAAMQRRCLKQNINEIFLSSLSKVENNEYFE